MPFGFRSGRTTDAVDVVLDRLRKIVVDDAPDVGDVDPAGGDVGRDEDAVAAAPEPFQRLAALLLRPVRVQALRGEAGVAERPHDAIGAMLGPRKDERIPRIGRDHFEQERGLLVAADHVDVLRRLRRRRALRSDGHLDGVLQVHAGERAEIGRHRRREEQRLPIRREHLHDAIELRLEPHVEHAVGLVEHEELDGGEIDRAALQVIDHAAGRRDDDGRPGPEGPHLRAIRHAADDERGLEVGAETLRPAVNLLGELARGREHDGRAARSRRGGPEPLDDRDHERGGLAGSGLCGTDDVTAGESRRDGRGLNRRRRDVVTGAERRPGRG